jgi:hypothetical protein
VGGVNYKVFLLDANSGNYHLIFNNWNNGLQLPDYDIVADRDYYFTITSTEVTENQATLIENVMDEAPLMQVRGKMAIYPGAITVYNINGQLVDHGMESVDLQHLSRGIYILQGRSGSHVVTIKLAINS